MGVAPGADSLPDQLHRRTGEEPSSAPADTWRPLHYLNFYRAVLSGLFLVLAAAGKHAAVLGNHDLGLFILVSGLYFVFSLAASFAIQIRLAPFSVQVYVHVLTDIVAITVLMYASGGVSSGLGMLLVVAVAGASILTAGRTAILFAALASLAVLLQDGYVALFATGIDARYPQSGLLGAACFAVAFLGHVLAARIRESEALAAQRGMDIASLELLNEHIIEGMQSGVLAVNAKDEIMLINQAARSMLGAEAKGRYQHVRDLSEQLCRLLTEWKQTHESGGRFVSQDEHKNRLIASFSEMRGDTEGTLIYLEDSSVITQHAQQLKLASLGRLTASIAHEIRNPLGAISHAGQLLAESSSLSDDERRMTDIIGRHSARMNGIIDNVLQLSRRRAPAPSASSLADWLDGFIAELVQQQQLQPDDVQLLNALDDTTVSVDFDQLHQVVMNLCENALRYAGEQPKLRFVIAYNTELERNYLDICDSGAGVDEENVRNLFEPFFTSETQGTGLGLYIARELCEVNQARLSYEGHTSNGHCFRILFPHRNRNIAPIR